MEAPSIWALLNAYRAFDPSSTLSKGTLEPFLTFPVKANSHLNLVLHH